MPVSQDRLARGPRSAAVGLAALALLSAPGPAGGQGRQSVALEMVEGMVMAAAFSPDGKRLAAGGMDKTARVWDLDKPDKPLVLDKQPFTVRGIAFSPDGTAVCMAADSGTVAVWDAGTGKARWTAELPTGAPRVAFSPDSKALAVCGYGGGRPGGAPALVHLLDAATGKVLWSAEPDDRRLQSVAFAPDGATVAAGGGRGVHLLDARTGKTRRTLKSDRFSVVGLAYGPDGVRVYGAGGKRVVGWDPATGEEKLNLDALPGSVHALAISADGKRLAAAGDTGTRPHYRFAGTAVYTAFAVWDTGTGELVTKFEGGDGEDIGTIYGMALSPDGKTVAAGSHGHLSLYDAATGGRKRLLLSTVSRPYVPK